MKMQAIKGICFGLTSGIITTLGLIVGLHSFSGSQTIVIGGILTIAIADSFSDALGIHISEEAEKKCKQSIWTATIATLISKFIFSLSFIIPILLFSINYAIIASIIWGLLLLGMISYFIAKDKKNNPLHVIGEHIGIAIIVIILTHYLGIFIAGIFGT